MECTICNLEHVGKKETPFNNRLNNHKIDVKDPKVILADKQFQKCDLRFNEHARFATIDRFFLTKILDTKIRNSLS